MKKCAFILFTGLFVTPFIIQAQTPYVSWEYNFPSPALTMSLTQKSDNSILYSGSNLPADSTCLKDYPLIDILLGELNNSEKTISDFCVGNEDNVNTQGLKVIVESDTFYDVFGYTNDTAFFGAKNHSNQGTYDVFFMKVNSNGIVRSCRLYGSPGDEYLNSAQKTKDGGWIFAAYSDDTGGEVPSHYWSTASPFPTTDEWVVKLDSNGNIQWSDIIGGSSNQYNPQVIQGTDGYYYAFGYSDSHDYDMSGVNPNVGQCTYVAKLDSEGNKKSIGYYGGFGPQNNSASISQLNNGKLFFSGTSESPNDIYADSITNGPEIWVVELDTSLNPIWYHDYVNADNDETYCADNILMPDGSIIVAGEHDASDIYIIKLDTSGHLIWSDSIGVTNYAWGTYITDGIVLDNDDIMLCGYTNASTGIIGDSLGTHSFLIELSNIAGIPPVPTLHGYYNLSVYPNPFSQSTTIKLDDGNRQQWQFILQDLLGRTVAQYWNEGEISLTIPRDNLPAGLYIGIARDDEGGTLGRTKIVVQ